MLDLKYILYTEFTQHKYLVSFAKWFMLTVCKSKISKSNLMHFNFKKSMILFSTQLCRFNKSFQNIIFGLSQQTCIYLYGWLGFFIFVSSKLTGLVKVIKIFDKGKNQSFARFTWIIFVVSHGFIFVYLIIRTQVRKPCSLNKIPETCYVRIRKLII